MGNIDQALKQRKLKVLCTFRNTGGIPKDITIISDGFGFLVEIPKK